MIHEAKNYLTEKVLGYRTITASPVTIAGKDYMLLSFDDYATLLAAAGIEEKDLKAVE